MTGTDMGRDAGGYRVRRTSDAGFVMDFRLTECCGASAKGGEHGVICRACHRPIDPLIGGQPEPPYADAGGHITALKVAGWGSS